jgi:hypothetical protein
MKSTTKTVLVTLASLAIASTAFATMDIHKEFKVKNPDAKCNTCHVPNLPKKGAADRNDFGKKVEAAKGKDGKIDWSKVPAAPAAPAAK